MSSKPRGRRMSSCATPLRRISHALFIAGIVGAFAIPGFASDIADAAPISSVSTEAVSLTAASANAFEQCGRASALTCFRATHRGLTLGVGDAGLSVTFGDDPSEQHEIVMSFPGSGPLRSRIAGR